MVNQLFVGRLLDAHEYTVVHGRFPARAHARLDFLDVEFQKVLRFEGEFFLILRQQADLSEQRRISRLVLEIIAFPFI